MAGGTTILLAQPWPTKAVVVGEPFLFAGETHTDTEVWIVDPADGSTIDSSAYGAVEAVIVPSLTLDRGKVYGFRIRYTGSGGVGSWSPTVYAEVPRAFALDEVTLPGEPSSGGTLPIAPELPSRVTRSRPLIEHRLETGHRFRRPATEDEGRRASFRFGPMTKAEADSLVAFLDARIAAAESFATGNPELSDRSYLAREGGYVLELIAPDTYTLELEAEEVLG